MKYFGGKNGKYLITILVLLVIVIFVMSFYISYSKIEGFSLTTTSNSISNIQDVFSLPGVAPNSLPTNMNNWAMVNEILEPDGTVVQDIVSTDGTVLTITNSKNVINTGNKSGSSGGVTGGNTGGNTGVTGGSTGGTGVTGGTGGNTYIRNTF